MNEEEFITEKYYRPYLVGYGGRTVQYKAWRALRPHVFGYGMTEDEAIHNLVHKVQPLEKEEEKEEWH